MTTGVNLDNRISIKNACVCILYVFLLGVVKTCIMYEAMYVAKCDETMYVAKCEARQSRSLSSVVSQACHKMRQ